LSVLTFHASKKIIRDLKKGKETRIYMNLGGSRNKFTALLGKNPAPLTRD